MVPDPVILQSYSGGTLIEDHTREASIHIEAGRRTGEVTLTLSTRTDTATISIEIIE
jgi:hypothetical protein